MRVDQLLYQINPNLSDYTRTLREIIRECSQFLSESKGLPVFRPLPSLYEDIQKVKVRKHRNRTRFSKTFNEAFEAEVRDLRQRAIFTNSQLHEATENMDLFYVFPINGYKFMYCPEVTHSTNDYQQVFESLFKQFKDDKAEQLIHDLLKFAYVKDNLNEGIEKKAEIIFYNVPYYYAARVGSFEYTELLSDMSQLSDN